jgi:hypothetical protein
MDIVEVANEVSKTRQRIQKTIPRKRVTRIRPK